MPLFAPITRLEHRALRAAVLEFKEAHPRGRAPVSLWVGFPGGDSVGHVVAPGQDLDQALRTDISAALLQRTQRYGPQRWAWLTRTGTVSALHDADAAWSCAWYAACAEARVDVPFVVVTRSGWRDPRTGVIREWRRLRRHGGAAGQSQV